MLRIAPFLSLLLIALATTSIAAEGWTPGPQASGDDTLVGFVENPAPGSAVGTASPVEVRGWAVDQSAQGWSGIDQVQVFNGPMDQGGQLLATGIVGLDRPDVADALGNPFFAASGFDALVPAGALPNGASTLSVYVHAPDKGWWQQQVTVQLQPGVVAAPQPAQPQPQASRQFSDDPLVVVHAPLPNIVVDPNTRVLDVTGIALDRNAPANTGVGGSGVSHVTVYLDGNKRDGTFLGEATLGKTSRDATGWGERFGTSGWAMQIHPNELVEDPHALFIYATSAVSPDESLVIVPFKIQGR